MAPSFDITDGARTPERRLSSVHNQEGLEIKTPPRRISTTKPPPMAPLPNLIVSESETENVVKTSRDLKPFKALPTLGQVTEQSTLTKVVENTVEKSPTEIKIDNTFSSNDDTDSAEDVEVFLKFNACATVTLPKGFTLAQLEWAARNQHLPTNFEFR